MSIICEFHVLRYNELYPWWYHLELWVNAFWRWPFCFWIHWQWALYAAICFYCIYTCILKNKIDGGSVHIGQVEGVLRSFESGWADFLEVNGFCKGKEFCTLLMVICKKLKGSKWFFFFFVCLFIFDIGGCPSPLD